MHQYTEKQIRSIITGLILSIFLGALDQTIVSIALPNIAHEFADIKWLSWVISGYLLTSTLATPLYGKFSDLYGRRHLLTWSIVIFLVTSVGCALSQSMLMLVVFRLIQGLGGGGLISLAQATVADVISPRERGRYQGYISGMYAVASVIGPLFGGALTHALSWRYIFWINLPIGLVALVISRRALKVLPIPKIKKQIDWLGIALLTLTLLSLLTAFTLLGQYGRITQTIVILIAVSVLGTVLFVVTEKYAKEPVIPLSLLDVREFSVGIRVLFVAFMQILTLTIMVPLELRMVNAMTASDTAWRLLPLSLSVPCGAFICGQLMSRTGHYKVIQLMSQCIAFLGMMSVAWIASQDTFLLCSALFMSGVGIGGQFPTTLVAVQNAVPKHTIGIATATTALFRSMGATIGVSVLSSVLLALLQYYLPLEQKMGIDMIKQFMVLPLGSGHDLMVFELASKQAFRWVYFLLALPTLMSIYLILGTKEQVLKTH
ncbi:multidrug resistance protein 3 [Ferrovum sp. JA12]|uniref:MDR family MFS transporter n=1 Tax=Ferrovum sp. JA12 TaxID=1356299 RepID=UPI00071417A1|nr:MDR family MFS transporter [Ferrovum sp. JA12]KRH79333.1 multidrug resistance protein 3 [Ferrovum sp. JA12]HQT82255.1 MDR family MFS transporter [Ferrovaceae bacterium]HQU06819.1 MDR family MFS transporter [Ferrovaceae bacterium]